MIFLGRLISWGLVLFGGVRIALGFWVANTFVTRAEWEAANRRYLGSQTSGDAIDQGFVLIAVGVAFGLLVRIAAATSKKASKKVRGG